MKAETILYMFWEKKCCIILWMLPAFTFVTHAFMTNLTSLSKTDRVSATAHSPLSLLEKAAAVFTFIKKVSKHLLRLLDVSKLLGVHAVCCSKYF